MSNKIQYYLPTYEEALAICEKYGNLQFYERVEFVDGFKVSTFNYRFTTYEDFKHPFGPKSQISAFEMRGLTFVFNADGTVYRRYLLMNKFFNLNQVEETQYKLIKDMPIKHVHEKVDGSVVSFFSLPNGKVCAKSKMSCQNSQAFESQRIYETNKNIKNFVDNALNLDLVPIFEFVSPFNRIVLKYKETELILLRLRNNISGEYVDLESYEDVESVKCTKTLNYTWDQIQNLVDLEKDIEGWVITLENGQMVKQKVKWYCDLHHTLTESINREDFLIEKAVLEEMNDLISMVEPDDKEVLDLIANVTSVVTNYIINTVKRVEQIVQEYHLKYQSNKKDWVCWYGTRDKYFGYAAAVIGGRDILDVVKNALLKHTYKLENAREFIRKGDF